MKPCEEDPARFTATDASDMQIRSAVADCFTCAGLPECFNDALHRPPFGKIRAGHVWVQLETRVVTAVPMPPEEFLPARRAMGVAS